MTVIKKGEQKDKEVAHLIVLKFSVRIEHVSIVAPVLFRAVTSDGGDLNKRALRELHHLAARAFHLVVIRKLTEGAVWYHGPESQRLRHATRQKRKLGHVHELELA